MNTRKKSNKNNKGRRKSYFQKRENTLSTPKRSYKDNVPTDTSSSVSVIKRPSTQEFKDACCAQSSSNTDLNVVPSKLRPEKHEEEDISAYFTQSEESEENIIVNINKLSNVISSFIPHNCEKPCPDIEIVNRLGLCVAIQVSCKNCTFTSRPIELYTRTKTSAKGPPSGTLNTSLLIPVLKSKVGITDLLKILACLNIKPPDRRGLQRKLNRMSDLMVDLNENQMLENQNYVRRILELVGNDNYTDVEVDSSYNNRPQSGYEAATQTFCPLIEQTTSLKLPISIETANINCPLKSCEHNTNSCKKNYSNDESIASTESKFMKKHLQKINEGNVLRVSSVTSDASAQVEKAVKDYAKDSHIPTRHYKCFIHKLRTFQKNFRYVKLTSTLPGCNKEIFMRKLSTNVRARIRVELIRIRKTSASEQIFIQRAKPAINNIISCMANDHQNCKRFSVVCTAHLSRFSASYLPYGRHLELNQNDVIKLKSVIEKNFSEYELSKISKLSTTNKCESLHSKVFTFAPKNTIWTRNFAGLCHSAVHSSSLGNGKSCILFAKAIGLKYKHNDPFILQMTKADKISRYQAIRKMSRKYKFQRYINRRNKGNRLLRKDSIFNIKDKTIAEEHCYANRTEFTS